MPDIKLIADISAYTLYSTRNSDKKFANFKSKVLERDNNTCTFCTFKAQKHMTVMNFDGNYKNNEISNLVAACLFCAQCHFLPFVGKVPGTSGDLIHLPDMSQSDLNALCHVLFCAMHNQAKFSREAEKIYKGLKLRSKLIEDVWGKSFSNPSQFGQLLIDTPLEKIKAVQHQLFSEVRLLPSFTGFSKYIGDWSKSAIEQGILD